MYIYTDVSGFSLSFKFANFLDKFPEYPSRGNKRREPEEYNTNESHILHFPLYL